MASILVFNLGSTSTKIALFNDLHELWTQNLKHDAHFLNNYSTIIDQLDFRKQAILQCLKQQQVEFSDVQIVMARGGLLKPIPSGVYKINTLMVNDLKHAAMEHASNLSAIIAYSITIDYPWIKAYIADPVVVDELDPLARYTGHPLFKRKSIFHALNQKAVARQYASSINSTYENLNLIVAHLGGGISVGAHQKGRVIDVNQALDGEGPFSPERSGTLPAGDLIRMAFSAQYTEDQMLKMLVGKGGFVAYTGTHDGQIIAREIANGNTEMKEVFDAMIWQLSKEIGAMASVLHGQVDAIILTGGLAYIDYLAESLIPKIRFIAEVIIKPGENEMEALAQNAVWLSQNRLTLHIYK